MKKYNKLTNLNKSLLFTFNFLKNIFYGIVLLKLRILASRFKIIQKIKKKFIYHLFIKNGIKGYFQKIYNFNRFYIVRDSISKSLSIDKDKKELPWYTFPAIEYLNNLDLKDKIIFEYGSGNSSLYFLKKGAKVISIEDDYKFFKIISKKNLENQELIFAEKISEYVERRELKDAEIISIDGSFRDECANYLCKKITSGSLSPIMIIFDNSDWFSHSIAKLDKNLGWHRVDFHGFGPINSYTWVTSIYLNPQKFINRVSKPMRSICGVNY